MRGARPFLNAHFLQRIILCIVGLCVSPLPPLTAPSSPTGTFTEDDVKINQHGLVLTREPAQTSTAEEATEVETVDGANVLEEGGKKKGVWPWKRTKRFCVKHLDELEDTGDVIGTGSSGVVRKCIHARSGKAMAVKVRSRICERTIAVDEGQMSR